MTHQYDSSLSARFRMTSLPGLYLDRQDVMPTAHLSNGGAADGKMIPVAAQSDEAKDAWCNVTRVRATAEWSGLYFGGVSKGASAALLADAKGDPVEPGETTKVPGGGNLGPYQTTTPPAFIQLSR